MELIRVWMRWSSGQNSESRSDVPNGGVEIKLLNELSLIHSSEYSRRTGMSSSAVIQAQLFAAISNPGIPLEDGKTNPILLLLHLPD